MLWFGTSALFGGAPDWMPFFTWLGNPLFSWALIGLVLADALHYLMDWLPFWR